MKSLLFISSLAIITPALGSTLHDAIQLDVHGEIPKKVITTCEKNLPPVSVNVIVKESAVEETNEESIRSLTNKARKINSPHVKDKYVLGLTTIDLSWHANAQYKSYEFSNPGIRCARPEMKIDLVMLYHKVQIAKEFSPRSCEYNFVREHEYQHVKINKENIKRYTREIARQFQNNFQSKIYYGSSAAVEKAVKNEIDNRWLPFISRTTKEMEKEGSARHALIDTPEEYAKANFACSGNIARILNNRNGK